MSNNWESAAKLPEKVESSTTIPRGSTPKWVEVVSILTSKVEDYDIVYAHMKV